jgi:hypothetical protein
MGLKFKSETSKRIYAYMLKRGKPLRLSDVKRDLNLGSSALVKHHIDNLMSQGLVERVGDGLYVAKPPSGYVKIWRFVLPYKVLLGSLLISSLPVELSLYSLSGTALLLYSMMVSMLSGAILFYDGYKSYEELTSFDNQSDEEQREDGS